MNKEDLSNPNELVYTAEEKAIDNKVIEAYVDPHLKKLREKADGNKVIEQTELIHETFKENAEIDSSLAFKDAFPSGENTIWSKPKEQKPEKKRWFSWLRSPGKKAAVTTGLVLGGLAAQGETINHDKIGSDSTEKKIGVMAKDVKDSAKINTPGTAEIKKLGISWIEANENVGGLEIEAKAIVPFSDTTKLVWILKFSSGTAEEMIAAAKKGGYKILPAKEFQKMYMENKNQAKNLRQTFSGEKVEDVDDTKAELYQRVGDNKVETGLKETHGVYPYIGLTGDLNRYEQDVELNYEAGLAVYKDVEKK